MKTLKFVLAMTVSFLAVSTTSQRADAAEPLSKVLAKAGMSDIIGDWVDPETKGRTHRHRYTWKIEDRVVEVMTKSGDMITTALMGVQGKTGDVFHMGADSEGTSSIGTWAVPAKGEAVLSIMFTSGDGQEGTLSIRHKMMNKDTLIVTIELPQPITYKLVREKK